MQASWKMLLASRTDNRDSNVKTHVLTLRYGPMHRKSRRVASVRLQGSKQRQTSSVQIDNDVHGILDISNGRATTADGRW